MSGHEFVRLAAAAMATRFEVVLAGRDPVQLRAAGEEALAVIAESDAALSPFRSSSVIARINREAHDRPVRVDALSFELLEACVDLHRATRGAFDPTVGPLMAALGFRGEPGSASALERARAAVGMDGVVLDPRRMTVRFARRGMAFDPGAIGKGHALDLAAETLREHGVGCALLHGGTSTVVAIGAPPGRDGWIVAVGRGPDAHRVSLRDAALSVSAPHGRVVRGAPHVLDPRRRRPSRAARLAAVVHPSARVADAWSTALLVTGAVADAPPHSSALVQSADGAVRTRDRTSGVRFFQLAPAGVS